MLYKHPFIYDAIKEAFDDFAKKHGYNPAELIADEIGLRGKHKKQQLYNKLNLYTSKFLKLDTFIIILKNLSESNEIPLRALANHFGYDLVKMDETKCDPVEIVLKTNIYLEVELGRFASEVMSAIEDGEIDYDEAKELLRRTREFRRILDKLDSVLQKIIGGEL